MKLVKGAFSNFGSYQFLDFDFHSQGLALIYGPTGAGKSTVMDMVAWTLFGVTAKNGAVDDVRSWAAPEPTQGDLIVELPNGIIEVTRIRGKAGQNDLYWEEVESGAVTRGKDINDTQRLLEKRLGVTAEEYLTGAYFHEFSPTGLFFTATAKDRRVIFDKIADVTLADKLQERASQARKDAKKALESKTLEYERMAGRHQQLLSSVRQADEMAVEYDATQAARVDELRVKGAAFEKTKSEKIQAITLKSERWAETRVRDLDAQNEKMDKIKALIEDPEPIQQHIENAKQLGSCVTCKQPLKEYQDRIEALKTRLRATYDNFDKYQASRDVLDTIFNRENPHKGLLAQAQEEINTYAERAEEELKKPNPFKAQQHKTRDECSVVAEAADALESEVVKLTLSRNNYNALHDLAPVLRGELLKRSIKQVEESTNRYLEKYFDAEIRVGFSLEGSDALNVSIQKSGHSCNYTQLSKGQRQLLKLTFVVSVMKAAANKAGVHFDNLFLDESLDGLDSELKVKAFAMLEELSTEHESIMVIDHDLGVQALFSKKFHVTMEGDSSVIEEERE